MLGSSHWWSWFHLLMEFWDLICPHPPAGVGMPWELQAVLLAGQQGQAQHWCQCRGHHGVRHGG